ncbi:MAG: hypothetical protein U0441_29985 [Polyangiaceae bacterium]
MFAARWETGAEILARVERIQMEFVRRQLRVTSVSESCLANLDKIPDFGEVIGSTTAEGFNLHYLTCTDHFAYVKDLHARDRIVPMVGNITDPAAIVRARARRRPLCASPRSICRTWRNSSSSAT